MHAKKRINQVFIIVTLAILFLLLAFFNLMVSAASPSPFLYEKPRKDTASIRSFSGKIQDSQSNQAVVFANVYLEGSNIGTVTNSDGEFLLKIPSMKQDARIGITHLGYKNLLLDPVQLESDRNIIYLDPVTIPIEEVIIAYADPEQLIHQALQRKSGNYSKEPVMMTSFYRETIKQNNNYVSVSEAVLDIYKSPYVITLETDRPRIYKGRKSQDVKKMDTVLFKLQGGPYTALLIDLVKHPGEVLSQDIMNLYDYSFSGINYVDDRKTYVISFRQKPHIPDPLYQGNIYIDAENLAFTGIDFGLNIDDPEMVSSMFIRKKPAGMQMEVLNANYLTQYRQVNDIWYLNYVRLETRFRCKWEKRLFSSVYTTMTEMAVTDVDRENIQKYRYRESAKMTDVLVEQVAQFEDPDFWGDYNIIMPDESIEAAIDKLSRKLKRRL